MGRLIGNNKRYIIDEYGEVIEIEDLSVLASVGDEEYNRWKEHNRERRKRGLHCMEYEDYRQETILRKKEQVKINERHEEAKQWKKKNMDELPLLIEDNMGGFTFLNYMNTLKKDLEPQYLYRFVILCCYMDYDNSIRLGNAKDEYNYATEKDLEEIWKLSTNETIRTKKALIEHDLLKIDGGCLIINKDYCKRGKVSKKYLKGSAKMFRNGLLELNKDLSAKEHKKMALFVELLPYVNYHYNIICSNPNESDIEKIKPLTPKEICKIVGYNENQSSRLIKELLELKVNGRDAIAMVVRGGGSRERINGKIVKTNAPLKKHIYINPFIYCKTNDAEKLKGIMTIFKIEE